MQNLNIKRKGNRLDLVIWHRPVHKYAIYKMTVEKKMQIMLTTHHNLGPSLYSRLTLQWNIVVLQRLFRHYPSCECLRIFSIKKRQEHIIIDLPNYEKSFVTLAFYGSLFVPHKRKILCRYNEIYLVIMTYYVVITTSVVCRYNEILCRYNDILSRYNDILSRYNNIRRMLL